jgi:hypothetical protein
MLQDRENRRPVLAGGIQQIEMIQAGERLDACLVAKTGGV